LLPKGACLLNPGQNLSTVQRQDHAYCAVYYAVYCAVARSYLLCRVNAMCTVQMCLLCRSQSMPTVQWKTMGKAIQHNTVA